MPKRILRPFGTLTTDKSHRTKHGLSRTQIYSVWQAMIDRCRNPNNPAWENYGGRGIRVCESWMDISNFVSDMGERPAGLTLGRKDNNGGYCQQNCEWQTPKQQARNTRQNQVVTVAGVTGCITELAEHFHIRPETVRNRMVKGWSAQRALTTPLSIHHSTGSRLAFLNRRLIA